jgi:hypothetical protein
MRTGANCNQAVCQHTSCVLGKGTQISLAASGSVCKALRLLPLLLLKVSTQSDVLHCLLLPVAPPSTLSHPSQHRHCPAHSATPASTDTTRTV